MERRPALLVSTVAAVAFATAGFGYAATNLLTKPADDQVGRLTVAQPLPAAPRPVQYIYDEVPVEVPAAPASPVAAAVFEDASEPAGPTVAPSSTTTTTAAASDASWENGVNSKPADTQHDDRSQPSDHDADD